jgi:hypothetical protein
MTPKAAKKFFGAEPWQLRTECVTFLLQITPGATIGTDCWGKGTATLYVSEYAARRAVKYLRRFDWLTVESVTWTPARPNEVAVAVRGVEPEQPAAATQVSA